MDVYTEVGGRIHAALEAMKADGTLPPALDLSKIDLSEPRDPTHGDLASNAAMALAKNAGLKPRDLADKLAAALRVAPSVAKVDVAD